MGSVAIRKELALINGKLDFEFELMDRTLDEMDKSVSERGRVSPLVGALVVKSGEVLGVAHRGQFTPGEHAEYTLLERKLGAADLTGATLFTTLEPCTQRNRPKIPCADRVIERGIAKVYIGTMDPNPDITGQGCLRLRQSSVEIALYPGELMSRIEEANKAFSRHHRLSPVDRVEVIKTLEGRSLDGWFTGINRIYGERNLHLSTLR